MSNINTVALSGNTTRDPEFKDITENFSVAKFGIAVSRRKKSGEEWVDDVSFFDVEVLGSFSKLVDRKVRRGDAVVVKGRLDQQTWTTDAGEKRSKVVVVVDSFDGGTIDGACFYKKDDAIAEKAAGNDTGSQATASSAAAAPADDDIPF